ncbi:MAG: hypothetical protein ABL964_01125 [Steroidobacteraceae bacterium]
MEPNYSEWLKKPAWSIPETLYLIAGIDPSYNPKNAGVIVDLDTGETVPAEPSEDLIRQVARAAHEAHQRGVPELIDRAIHAGIIKSADSKGEYFPSHEILLFLVKREIELPERLLGALGELSLAKALEPWLGAPLELLPADVRARVQWDLPAIDWDNLTQDQRARESCNLATRDQKLQFAAEALVVQWKKEGRKSISKRKVANHIASTDEWKELTAIRIERILVATWAQPRSPKRPKSPD